MKAGDIFVRIAKLELVENIVAHTPGGAGGESGDGLIGEVLAQGAELAVLGAESWPHSEMQWASSMAKKARGTRCSQPMVSARASRSGERYRSRNAPCSAARITARCSSGGREL